uniref:Glycine--tRNA ligase beta subunit n=1 Tax=Magnetococcus massalia (strain MO-1) TaxID=451514 RepID=A0A1S7LDZ0_MAGMO|nr:Glycyl-tRNA synthetase beta subunit [Candidatus Magnetococcus massalia]
MLPGAIEAMKRGLTAALKGAGLGFDSLEGHGTPRRLVTVVQGLDERQADMQEERRGPAVKAAFDADGNPTKAAQGFARGCGVEVDELGRIETPKGEYLAYTVSEPGQYAAQVLPGVMVKVFNGLPWPKSMRWSDGETRFVRPVQTITALLDGQLLEVQLADKARCTSEISGHRFMGPGPYKVSSWKSYQKTMQVHKVMLELDARCETIREQAKGCAQQVGGEVELPEALVSENACLVEWPVCLLGSYDESYLEIPPEVLTTSMKYHQKYFPVLDADGKLLPHFVVVANMETKDQSVLVKGYQRVLKARLEDAAFYWQEDRKTPLTDRLDDLKAVVWQNKLGNLHQKSERLAVLGAEIARLAASDHMPIVEKAGRYSKCDLVSGMVYEFPELQGIMGGYYLSREAGSDEAVAQAIREHYMPAGANDDLPTSLGGRLVSIADKLDTLVGCFGMGITPTGTKDPFGLRRAALGIIRLMLDGNGIPLLLREACAKSYQLYTESGIALEQDEQSTVDSIVAFFYGRLQAHLKSEGLDYDLIDAVQALGLDSLHDVVARVKALALFKEADAYASLVAANKRMSNILGKLEEGSVDLVGGVAMSLLKEPAEHDLYNAISSVSATVRENSAQAHYTAALSELASLREPIDTFFDEVLVMADDPHVRQNRLRLLHELKGLFHEVADVSRLVVAEK